MEPKMKPRDKKGRKIRLIIKKLFSMRYSACCISAITSAALLQLPAFVSSCVMQETKSPAYIGQQIYIQCTKNPRLPELDCFFFHTEGARLLDSYQQIPVSGDGTVTGISTTGPRLLVVVSGSGENDWYGIRQYPDLCKLRFSLMDEDPGNPQMLGEVFLDDTPRREVKLSLRPALAQIRLRSVSADFSGYPYDGEPFVNTSVYLGNAVTECLPLALDGVRPAALSWINTGDVDSVGVSRFPFPEMLLQEGIGPIGKEPCTVSREFYCYPGPDTRIVLVGRVGDDLCYYPVPLGTLLPGRSYELDVRLTRKGAPSPYMPVQSGTVVAESTSFPWDWNEPLYLPLEYD